MARLNRTMIDLFQIKMRLSELLELNEKYKSGIDNNKIDKN